MLDLGKHAVFIWSSYAIVVVVLAGLVAWLIGDGGRLKRRLEDLEARGVRRRSAAGDADRGA
jgi:heme exporter protein D